MELSESVWINRRRLSNLTDDFIYHQRDFIPRSSGEEERD